MDLSNSKDCIAISNQGHSEIVIGRHIWRTSLINQKNLGDHFKHAQQYRLPGPPRRLLEVIQQDITLKNRAKNLVNLVYLESRRIRLFEDPGITIMNILKNTKYLKFHKRIKCVQIREPQEFEKSQRVKQILKLEETLQQGSLSKMIFLAQVQIVKERK